MSDELTIQGVNPQAYQPQKTSTMPYALGGAAIGAVGAGIGTSMVKKGATKTLDELVEEANKNDKFEYASEIKSKKAALNDAENKLAEASKAVYEGNEKEALETAIKKRDAELARLTETKSGSKIFKPVSWKDADIDLNDIDDVIVRTKDDKKPKKFTRRHGVLDSGEVEAEYNSLKNKYEQAVRDFESTGKGQKLKSKLDAKQNIIDNYFKEIRRDLGSVDPKDYSDIFSTDVPEITAKDTDPHKIAHVKAANAANSIYPELKATDYRKFSQEQLESFANKLDDGAKRPGTHAYSVDIRVPLEEGSIKTKKVTYTFSDDMLQDFLKQENASIKSRRAELINTLLDRSSVYMQAPVDEIAFQNQWVKDLGESYVKKTGFTTSAGELDITKLLNEAGLDKSKNINVNAYQSDIDALTSAVKKDPTTTKMPKAVTKNGHSYSGMTVEQALETAKARKNMLQTYVRDYKDHLKNMKNITSDYDIIHTLEEQIESAHNADKNIAKAKQALLDQFPTLGEGVERAGLTEAQAMEKESYKRLAKIVEDKQAAYDKIVAEKGKVNETAKKTAQEAVEKAKSELDNLVNTINSKVKGMSGGAKAAWIAGVAAAGALIGAGIANSKNKKAQVQPKEIIA